MLALTVENQPCSEDSRKTLECLVASYISSLNDGTWLSVNRETRKYSVNECSDDLQPAPKNAL
jgi:hypothetical protein